MRIETSLIHAGDLHPRPSGAITTPIYQSSTFEFSGSEDYHDIQYLRLSNSPNHVVLHERLAAIEQAEAALVTGSGMSAISSTLLSLLRAGDHVLALEGLYGGTQSLLTRDFPALNIQTSFVDGQDPSSWDSQLTPRTRVFYVETLTNPLMKVPALDEVVRFARQHQLVTVIDNTFATPINFQPLRHGFDIAVHSASKYLNGHSDIVAGAVVGNRGFVSQIKHKLDHLGGTLDPHACFLLQRGLKTLAVRVRYQNQSALEIAKWLERHPAVKCVNHPGLESSPSYARARTLLTGAGGTFSFELQGGLPAAASLLKRVKLPISAPSLGGTETLITRPATTSHSGVDPKERERQGISESLVRLSVGLEATEDLLSDLASALG